VDGPWDGGWDHPEARAPPPACRDAGGRRRRGRGRGAARAPWASAVGVRVTDRPRRGTGAPAPAGRPYPPAARAPREEDAGRGRRGRTAGAGARPPGRDGPEGPCAVGASSRRRPSPWTEPTPCCGQRGGGRRQGSRRPIGPRPRPAASPEGRVRLTGVGAAVPLPAGTRAGVRPDRPPARPSRGEGEPASGSRRPTRAFNHVGARPPRPVAGAPGPGPGQGRGVGMRPPSAARAARRPPALGR